MINYNQIIEGLLALQDRINKFTQRFGVAAEPLSGSRQGY